MRRVVALADERYISLETFRKDGTGVKTPVWVADLDGKPVIVTDGTSYKVKRLRANPRFRAAGCDARGKTIHGAWHEGTARLIERDPDFARRADGVLGKKYGYQYRILNFFSSISGKRKGRVYLELTLSPAAP